MLNIVELLLLIGNWSVRFFSDGSP